MQVLDDLTLDYNSEGDREGWHEGVEEGVAEFSILGGEEKRHYLTTVVTSPSSSSSSLACGDVLPHQHQQHTWSHNLEKRCSRTKEKINTSWKKSFIFTYLFISFPSTAISMHFNLDCNFSLQIFYLTPTIVSMLWYKVRCKLSQMPNIPFKFPGARPWKVT